ncbi:U-box domain-containing protein 33 [Nymphaea thermarum]|nr:U-box domain-containing protein 33 [Nymphaea thermarum]
MEGCSKVSPWRKKTNAMGRNMKEEWNKLLWSLEAYQGAKVVILHVHQPSEMAPAPCNLSPSLSVAFFAVPRSMVEADHLITESENVGKGIVELVAKHDIGELVMGAAADKNFSKYASFAMRADLLSAKEQRLGKEAEAAVSRERLQLEMLREMSVEKASLERRITEVVHELEEKNQKLDDLLHALDEIKREKLEVQRQMEDAMAKVEELNIRQEEFGEASRMAHSFTEFSLAELVDATNGFDPGLKIGEGGFGTVYRGRIRYTTVAIKMLNSESTQAGGSEFHEEVNVLSRVRHPHLVTFIGACTEACALVYEYLPNGSLEDILSCKDGTPPLAWHARTSIAAEICSALLFLHSAGVVHGDLKPGNILLDAKLSAKIGNFGICHLLPEQVSTVGLCVAANPNVAFAYLDPEFLATGELTPLSDVYSFGVIILQLLTGRSPLWIARDVQKFVFAGNLQALIDPAAGDWPFVQAVQLANLGLECCNMSRRCRPDLETEVWRVLEPLKGSLAPSTHSMVTNSRQPPEYFICPIFQETMQDPQVAADGFTYEAEALRGWLDSGHDTSPMTNLKLSHLNLTPNHTLRSAIQEWKVFVAVGKNMKEERNKILWSLEAYRGAKVVILHVHQPDQMVEAEHLVIESDDVGKGIVELVAQHEIEELVMGAAADKSFSKRMKSPTSKKAIYVNQHALPSCRIRFVCKGTHIRTREPYAALSSPAVTPSPTHSSPEMLARLKKAMEEAQSSKKEAFQESQWRQQAEQEALEAIRRARIAEVLSTKEQRLRKEAEAALSRERLELEKLVKQHKDAVKELHEMSIEKASLERRITEVVHELEEKNQKLDDLLHALDEMKREKLEVQRQMEDAMAKVEELNTRQEEFGEASRMAHSFTEFSLVELVDATNGFDPGLKIGEGGFGTVYRGRIRYTTVAIKMLNSESMQGGSEFHQEVNVLSRMRHPHLVTLIGACTESCALVYEYLPNGSLEDRLSCKDGTPPLTWQARTSIAAEICSALLFLHSAGVVHGDLKPGNILLDAKLSAKIGDFGICRLLPEQNSTVSLCVTTNPKGTFAYMDPEFLATGELTPLSDVYSFGVIILQLLTGRPPLWIARDVHKAVSARNLQAIIDPTAGDWPYVQAVQLANLGLECCNMSRRCRPDLETEVWRVLEPLKGSLAPSTHSMVTDSRRPPEYFICPIFQEIMRDPQVAADGFTYEAEALLGWLDSGHDTSPMTNLKLSHLNLTPNRALRSAIQEWCSHS